MSEIEQALKQLANGGKQEQYARYTRYYNGDHPLAFATDKFKSAFSGLFSAFADNLCPSVVDAVADRLTIKGFSVEEGDSPDRALEELGRIWQRNRMDRRSGEAHLEALRTGDSYLIVWPDPTTGEPTIYPNSAANTTLSYDPEVPGRITWAAKCWKQDDGRLRLTMYHPDRIEKWVSTGKNLSAIPQKENAFEEYEPLVANPYEEVPVFHLANNASVGELGRSELENIVPLQDALNKSIADMLVAMEFVALPQRWITGFEPEVDERTGEVKMPFKVGAGNVWTLNEDAKFGEFSAANLTQFLNVQNDFRMEIARVSGTPLHYFMLQSGNWPSGEAMRTAEARFVAKVRDRQTSYGNTWEDALAFALKIKGIRGVRLSTQWEDPAPRSQMELAQMYLVHQQLASAFLKRLEYSDVEIAAILADKASATNTSTNANTDTNTNPVAA